MQLAHADLGEQPRQLVGRYTRLLDVTDEKSIAAAAQEVEKKHGHLDILVNNAGVLADDTQKKPSEQKLDEKSGKNLRGSKVHIQDLEVQHDAPEDLSGKESGTVKGGFILVDEASVTSQVNEGSVATLRSTDPHQH